MQPREFIKVAWKSVVVNKMRSLLTMLGIIIGVASVIIMISISAGTEAEISDQITGLGSNLIYISPSMTQGGVGGARGAGGGMGGGTQGGLVMEDAYALEELDGITGMSVEQSSSQNVSYAAVALEDINVVGSTVDYPSVRDIPIDEGRYFTQTEVDRKVKVAVLGASLAEELFGDEDPIGQTITVGTVKLTIVGVLEEKGLVSGEDLDSQLYVPITVVFQQFVNDQMSRVMGDRVRMIYVEVEEGYDLDDVILQITLLLAKRHDLDLESLDFNVLTQQDIITTQEATTSAFRTLLAWVAGVSLIVGGIGIMNIMLVSVTERTHEIGLRQAIGATPDDIRWQFLSEALLLSLIGGLIGVAVGIVGAVLFGAISDMRTFVVPISILLAFLSSAIVGAFFGYYPANQAAQMDPIDALRYE
ncbi:MAG: ABC transporter permease [Anaerolineales bacterium]|nr:ABC transporter permease [Anaerolineales bacterium]